MAKDLYSAKRSKIKSYKATVANQETDTVEIALSFEFSQHVADLNKKRKLVVKELKAIKTQLNNLAKNGDVDDDIQVVLKTMKSNTQKVQDNIEKAMNTLSSKAVENYNATMKEMMAFYKANKTFSTAQNASTSDAQSDNADTSD